MQFYLSNVDRLYREVILSNQYVIKKVDLQLNNDVEECKFDSAYDPNRHMVSFMITIQLKYVSIKVSHACCTSSKFIFDTNVSK